MTTTNKSIHRATIALALPVKVADLVLYSGHVVQKMTGNPSFPAPTPTLAALTSAIDDLQTAETAALSGTVVVTAGPRAAYAWQTSVDGGKTWVSAPSTMQSKTTIPGRPSGATVQVRVQTVTPKLGPSDGSAPISVLVK